MIKNKNIKVKKMWKKYGVLAALLSLTTLPFIAIATSNNQINQTNHTPNTHNSTSATSKLKSRTQPQNWNLQGHQFLLNANNAITLANPINSKTPTSIVNGPEGFLADSNNKITYLGYDGTLKWEINSIVLNTTNQFLISSYYNVYTDHFVILYSTSNTEILVSTINANTGTITATSTPINVIGVASRYTLFPINNSATNNQIDTYAIVSRNQAAANVHKLDTITLNEDGTINQSPTLNFVDTPGSESVIYTILSAGAVEINGKNYYIFLSSFTNGQVWLRVFTQDSDELSFLTHQSVLDGWNLTNGVNVIDLNIPEIAIFLNNNKLEVAALLNADPKNPWLFGASADINAMNSLTINSINLGKVNISDFNLQNGRFYGNYLYCYLMQGTQKNIIRLKVSDQNDGTWTTDGLQWDPKDDDYTDNNERIILYDLSYVNTGANIIAQPFYASDYNGVNNLFVVDQKATNLWLLNGTKRAFAYQTSNIKDINNVAISGVQDIFVADADSNLKTYFTETLLKEYFSQYQDSTNYTIEYKNPNDPEIITEHAKGKIPATIVINNGYNNNSLAPESRTFDIVLTGFKNFKTTIDSQPIPSINLNNTLAQSITSNQPINDDLKNYLIENVILPKNTLTINDIQSIEVDDYNNLTGTLVLRSITLKRHYAEGGILVTTPQPFTQPITINGFKKIVPTALNTNLSIVGGFNTTLASAVSDDELKGIIFINKDAIFVANSLPDDFDVNNIVSISKSEINDKDGTLKISFELNNYYATDGKGSLQTSPNQSFGEVLITGFKQVTLETTINKDPTITTDLNEILAQTVNLNNAIFKQYLLTNVIFDPSKTITADNITDIVIKPDSYNNINGTLVLESITLDRWYDDKSILQTSKQIFPGEINLQGFKRIVPTALNVNLSVDGGLNTILASAVSDDELKDIIFKNKDTIFVDKSLPDNFNVNNIVAITKSEINDKDGTLKISFELNNYYATDGKGTLQTSPNQSFGEIIITGFNQVMLETTINNNPAITTNLEKILAQTVNLNNAIFKQYLLTNVIVDQSNTITADNITDIVIKPDSYNNINGTLVLESITLNHWYDDKSILQTSDKPFVGEINIGGFKKVVPTALQDTPLTNGKLTIDGELRGVKASEVTDEQLWEIILAKQQEIFVPESIPEGLESSLVAGIYPSKVNINDKDGTIEILFDLTSFYANDNQATLITYNANDPLTKKEFGPLIITGFIDVSTRLKTTTEVINLPDQYPYEQQGFEFQTTTGGSLEEIKKFIFDNMIENKDGLVYTDIGRMWLDSYDNKEGILRLEKIEMTRSIWPNGVTINTPWIFRLHVDNNQGGTDVVPLEIKGFEKVAGFTKENSSQVTVSDGLEAIKISELSDPLNQALFLNWIQRNKNNLILNLPDKPTIADVQIVGHDDNMSDIKSGILAIKLKANSYYVDDNLYTYKNEDKEFTVILNGFKNDLATGVITSPTTIGMMDNVLAQTFAKTGINPDTNLDISFKQHILDSIITGKKDGIIIEGYEGDYNNLKGEFILTSITLNQYYDEAGVVQPGQHLPIIAPEGITINGFKTITPTALNTNLSIDGGLNAILASVVSDDELKGIIFTNKDTIFVNNSLPDNFNVNNIVAITKSEINDKDGTLKISFELNNYYATDGKGTLQTSPNQSFGEIIISGFSEVNNTTSIANSDVSVGIDILPQIFIKDPTALNNIRKYLFDNVIKGSKVDITADDIKSITFKQDSYDNTTGTLIVETITLSKWYDDKSILQTTDKDFSLPDGIIITGFKKIKATDLVKNTISWTTVDQEWWQDIKAKHDYKELLQIFIFDKGIELFVANSLPDTFAKTDITIVSEHIVDKTEKEIKLEFTLSNYYDNDRGTWIQSGQGQPKSFTLTITGFKESLKTYFEPTLSLGQDELSQDYYKNNDITQLKEIVLNNFIKNQTGQNNDNITVDNIEIDDTNVAYNNKTGEVTITGINLNKHINYKGEAVTTEFPPFNITITGFKKINAPTGIKDENTKIEGSLANSEVNEINGDTLKKWIIDNQNNIFDSLPTGASPIIVEIIPNANDGTIKVNVTLSKYYKDNDKYELVDDINQPLHLTFNIIGFVKTDPFPIIPVSLGAGAAVVATIIAITTIIYFYRKKKYKTTNVTSDKDL